MFDGIQGLKDIANRFKSIADRFAREADYIVERGVSGIWTYKKYASGEFEIRGGDMFTFTSGYKTISLPEDLRLTIFESSYSGDYRNPYIIATGRYLGSTRSVGIVYTPAGMGPAGNLTIYGRVNGNSLAGSYWVDVTIKGYWK